MAKLLIILDDSAWTIAYDLIVAALKADDLLERLVPAGQWTTYTEESAPVSNVPHDARGLPAINLMPYGAGAAPQTQVRQSAPLGIKVTITTDGQDVRDTMNLWGAFADSIFTGDGVKALGNAIRAALKAAGDARGKFLGSLETITLGVPTFSDGADASGNPFMAVEASITAMMTVPK